MTDMPKCNAVGCTNKVEHAEADHEMVRYYCSEHVYWRDHYPQHSYAGVGGPHECRRLMHLVEHKLVRIASQ